VFSGLCVILITLFVLIRPLCVSLHINRFLYAAYDVFCVTVSDCALLCVYGRG